MSRRWRLPAPRTVIGMVHLGPLPGTPFHEEGTFEAIRDRAVASALALQEGGAHGCLVQTVDGVYSTEDESDPARTVAVGLIVDAVVRATSRRPGFQVGVQLMYNALRDSLAVAKVAGGAFVRASALVGTTLSAHGVVTGNPLRTATYRRAINATDIGLVAEVDTMHFRWHGEPKPTGEVARAAQRAGADAVAVSHPDESRALEMVRSVRRSAPGLPVVLAGHTTHDNAARLLAEADGAFVGSCLEPDGWGGAIDVERVRAYMDVVRAVERS